MTLDHHPASEPNSRPTPEQVLAAHRAAKQEPAPIGLVPIGDVAGDVLLAALVVGLRRLYGIDAA